MSSSMYLSILYHNPFCQLPLPHSAFSALCFLCTVHSLTHSLFWTLNHICCDRQNNGPPRNLRPNLNLGICYLIWHKGLCDVIKLRNLR